MSFLPIPPNVFVVENTDLVELPSAVGTLDERFQLQKIVFLLHKLVFLDNPENWRKTFRVKFLIYLLVSSSISMYLLNMGKNRADANFLGQHAKQKSCPALNQATRAKKSLLKPIEKLGLHLKIC